MMENHWNAFFFFLLNIVGIDKHQFLKYLSLSFHIQTINPVKIMHFTHNENFIIVINKHFD